MIEYPLNTLYASIQGEGAKTGTPMIILRLQGCDVGCPWCDTKQTWALSQDKYIAGIEALLDENDHQTGPRWTKADGATITAYLAEHFKPLKWVLLTGGEPGLYDLGELVACLHAGGFRVALETSGTASGVIGSGADWMTVSPKIGMPGKKLINAEVVKRADEIKWVVGKPNDITRLEQFLIDYEPPSSAVISLQPLSASEKATRICVMGALAHGWNLSVQVHKVVGLA